MRALVAERKIMTVEMVEAINAKLKTTKAELKVMGLECAFV